ncbi:MAG: 3-dehydroquinate synthase [Propionibacteriaceae bacterium]|uniref:3-dehydroquinate synthase n=1 Tax=Propionibacterium ruminifibrarum TaxID=1962131 RepID=A0A375HXB6_9ACTN|nr:3-dehydroquinate synthase [Propionibacterium ruminifibrarum]MBE6476539.1 3-dehydroquinate synthase [Propionibacteriaceae bacterium]SPF67074.1 3-dehydroquinate synthase [Propionibacterium ruminifibrarum]
MSVVEFATEKPYQAVIGPGVLDQLGRYLGAATKVGVLHAPPLSGAAQRAADTVRAAGAEPVLIELPEGESAKTPRVLADTWSALAVAGFTRGDLIVGIGGGATTDLAGFIAATWMRGIRWVSAPTTVLAMVDAGIGGKTGADLPEGKNLIGAFWEPSAVLADTGLLGTLPVGELRAGLGEVIKHGFIADGRTLDLIAASPSEALDPTSPLLTELITRSVQVKARVVSADLRESMSVGDDVGREQLNYGHTLGHAIEAGEHFTRRHGECVGLGMIFAAELAHRTIGLAAEHVDRHRRMLELVGLPTSYRGIGWERARALMARDKKTRGSTLRFVGLRAPGDVTMIVDPPEQALLEAWDALTG